MRKQDIGRMLALVDARYIALLTGEEAQEAERITVHAAAPRRHVRELAAMAAAAVLCVGAGAWAVQRLSRPAQKLEVLSSPDYDAPGALTDAGAEEYAVAEDADAAEAYGAAADAENAEEARTTAKEQADAAAAVQENAVYDMDADDADLDTDALEEVAMSEFELLQYDVEKGRAYVLDEGTVYVIEALPEEHPLPEDAPSGLLLDVSWSGVVEEEYPGVLVDVKSIEIVGERPDFVSAAVSLVQEKQADGEEAKRLLRELPDLTDAEYQGLLYLLWQE